MVPSWFVFLLTLTLSAFSVCEAEATPWLTHFGDLTSRLSVLGAKAKRKKEDLELARVIRALELFWHYELGKYGIPFTPAKVVIFSGEISTGCGRFSSQDGIGYCPKDSAIYIDPEFWNFLKSELNSNNFGSRIYVLAHEYGHHIQHTLDIFKISNTIHHRIGDEDRANLRRYIESGADSMSGYFMQALRDSELISDKQLKASKKLTQAIGDDSKELKDAAMREQNHGRGEERLYWFERGLNANSLEETNPFEDSVVLDKLSPFVQRYFLFVWNSPRKRAEALHRRSVPIADLLNGPPLIKDGQISCQKLLER